MTDSSRPKPSPPPSGKKPKKRGAKGASAPPFGSARGAKGREAQRARLLKGALWGSAALACTLGLAAAGVYLGYGRARGPSRGVGVVEVDWPPGLDSLDAAARLVELGLASNAEALTIFFRATGGTSDFVPGPHLLPEGLTPYELRRLLTRSLFRPGAKVTIPEGFNRFDIASRLEKLKVASKKAFLSVTADPAFLAEVGVEKGAVSSVESAEGYLFPATYEFPLDSDPRDVVRRLVQEANKRWDVIVSQRRDGLASLEASPLKWSRREVIIIASMIEKEAVVDDERPIIASVFINRLLDPAFPSKRLESDPTSSYGCLAWPSEAPSCADFAGKPTPAINRDAKNRYSTYTHPSLPPGPICNPGARSIEAVLAPAPTHYFYFVASGAGRHAFSETFDAHNDAIRRGRSP